MPRLEAPVLDELPEHLLKERQNLEAFHKTTVDEPYHEFLGTFPLQASYLTGIETLDAAVARQAGTSKFNEKKAWSMAPKTKFSYTTLHEVVRSGDLKTLQTISETYEVDLNCKSRSGRTPLHYAILMGHDEMISFLLSRKVDVSIVDKIGCNALHLAVALNRESLAKTLMSLGLDFSQKNNAGHRPLEIMSLNILGYKNTNLYKHLIKLIIKRQTGIVEKWLKDLYSCGIFEMSVSPRELTGSQLLDLQDQNSELFVAKWATLQLVMDPDFKSTGRSTLPGEGFRDDRPSSLTNGRFLELWTKYYESLKLGCKPSVLCKFSKKTEPDTVHLKYEIRGIKKGRYDPEFIDMGMMVVTLKNDCLLKETVDPDISVEQPAIVKPTTSGKPAKQEKKIKKASKNTIEDSSSEASESDALLDEDSIVSQEIESMIEIIEIVHQMTSYVVAKIHGEGSYSDVAELNAQVAVVIDSIITNIEEDAIGFHSQNRPLSSGLSVSLIMESILQSLENGEAAAVQSKAARFRLEGPIIDLRSLPWEFETAARTSNHSATLRSESHHSRLLSSESTANLRNDLRAGRMNLVSSASTANAAQNDLTRTMVVPPLNLEISQTLRRKHEAQ
jgi:hypothetical protein